MKHTDDHSTGDGRAPYSDEGGPAAHHAKTHDVAREAASNSTSKADEVDEFAHDLENDNHTSR